MDDARQLFEGPVGSRLEIAPRGLGAEFRGNLKPPHRVPLVFSNEQIPQGGETAYSTNSPTGISTSMPSLISLPGSEDLMTNSS